MLQWARRTWQEYQEGQEQAGDGRPLPGYALLMGIYGTGSLSLALLARRRSREGGLTSIEPLDVALAALAVYRTARTLSKDAVTSPLRAPFTTYVEPAGPGEVTEAPRSGPVRHAVGELLGCPFCLSQWVATAAVGGYLLAPRTTRWIVNGMAVVAVADGLQLAYGLAEQRAE